MAPIIKTTLTLLSVSASVISVVNAQHNNNIANAAQHHGKHLKLAKRTLFEDLGKREHEFAPYGYDRCGVPRKKPYVRKAGASPSASYKYTPCPTDQSVDQKAKANPAVPTHADEAANGGDNYDDIATITSGSPGIAQAKAAAAQANNNNNNGNAAPTSSSWSSSSENKFMPASSATKSSSQWQDEHTTEYTTSWVDVTSTHTKSSEEQAPAPSSSKAAEDTWVPPKANVNAVAPGNNGNNGNNNGNSNGNNNGDNGNGNNGNSGNGNAGSSSSAAPPAYTPPASTGNGVAKLGLAWDWRNPNGVLQEWAGAGYIYTWSAYPPSDALPSGMEFLPQYWGPGKESDIQGQIARGVIRPGMTILGYNEPDQPGQANLGVWDAIASFKRQLTPLASQGYKITSPACTSDDKGFNWIKEFMDNCQDCGISILQTHFYGTNADDFIAYIQKLRNTFGLPIIISEYASETFGWGADLSLEETQAFVAKTQNWIKQQDYIISYMYFGPVTPQAANGVNPNSLMIDGAGHINALGRQYLADR